MNADLALKLKKSYLYDVLKPDIDPFDRCEIIKSLIADEGISQNKFGEKYGIPKSTLSNWLLFDRSKKDEYDQKQKEGFGKTTLYRSLKHGSAGVQIENEQNAWIEETRKRVAYMRKNSKHDHKTPMLIEELINELNNWTVEINNANKRKNK